MTGSGQFETLPEGLPVPVDDGMADHLVGLELPNIDLMSTLGNKVNLAHLLGWNVIFVYPMTGRPGVPLPEGWDAIPGARGCTPQACSFRNSYSQITSLGCNVFGLSTQSSDYQKEVAERLHLPYALLSDSELELAAALRLPTFMVDGVTLLRRLTMIINEGVIVKTFYPVFPSDKNADEVIRWLKAT
jgi:peroxiredoxin